MRKLSILIIEDDAPTQALLKNEVQDNGHLVRVASTLRDGVKILEENQTDLLILDRGLPDGDGVSLCLNLRNDARFKTLPILMLTGKTETVDKILGLRYGADDYLAKPFDIDELLARMDALIRRITPALAEHSPELACGPIAMNLAARRVTVAGRDVSLTGREFDLLRILVERAGTVLERDFLIEMVWKSPDSPVTHKAVDVTVLSLRKKLNDEGAMIEAVRGLGYMISPPKS